MVEQTDLNAAHVDVTNKRSIREFVQKLAQLHKPVYIMSGDQVIARLLPPDETVGQLLTQKPLVGAEEQSLRERGRELVAKARQRNKGVPARVIEREVRRAVRQVRQRRR